MLCGIVPDTFYNGLKPHIIEYHRILPAGADLQTAINMAQAAEEKYNGVQHSLKRSGDEDNKVTKRHKPDVRINAVLCLPKFKGGPYGTEDSLLWFGADNKLAPSVVKYRKTNGFCLRCGQDNHVIDNCSGDLPVVDDQYKRYPGKLTGYNKHKKFAPRQDDTFEGLSQNNNNYPKNNNTNNNKFKNNSNNSKNQNRPNNNSS